MKRQLPPMIIVYNKIHHIIKLLFITNVNSIFMIEQQNRLLTELIIIGKVEMHDSIHAGIPTPYKNKYQLFHLVINTNIGGTYKCLFR